jgi:2-polyprenyl-3-methyl-5-hydroxy-6-metoxy-1,4-benzoquinol methylase
MADMEQLDAMISELDIKPGMALLDFGCGDGQIAEYIADTTRAAVTGIDIANEAIQLAEIRTRAKSGRVKFCVADLEGRLESLSENRFDRIYAVDSLFFVPDQLFVTRRLLHLLKPEGMMGIFYICRPEVGTAETPLAHALTALGISYHVRDFSEQNAAHWKKKKQVLLELEDMFKGEGNEFLYKNRLAECDGLEHFHRYLYLAAGVNRVLPGDSDRPSGAPSNRKEYAK